MKRRDFILGSAGIAGAALPAIGLGQARPCPPPSVGVAGGTSVITSCGSTTADADWLLRSTGAGVVWAHDFRSHAEVDQFRSDGIGIDPTDSNGSTVKYITTDGITGGGCLEITIPTGGTANGGWWRPMSAIRAGDNGKSVDDAGAGGALQRRAWNSASPQAGWNWRTGYYGHPDYQAQYPTWQGQSNVWDGWEFYVQFRAKISASRWTPGNPPGKLMFIDVTGLTSYAETVIISDNNNSGYWYQTNPFRMYTSFGSNPNSALSSPQGDGGGASIQPGGPFASTCIIGGPTNKPNQCWEWPKDEWVTVLVHVIPGHDNPGHIYDPLSKWSNKDHVLECYVARQGESAYTMVFQNKGLAWVYGTNGNIHPPAFNSICPSGYMNNIHAVAGWSHRYDQIIFSKQFIPCPQV